MALRIAINHKTSYQYDRQISLSPHIFRLRPAVHSRTAIESYSLKITPKEHFINWQQDPFGNFLARVVFPEKTKELSIEVDIVANMQVINPFDFFVDDYAENYPFKYEDSLKKELLPYLEVSEESKLLDEWVSKVNVTDKKRIVDFLVELNLRLYQDIKYTIRLETGVQTCEDTLTKRSGSCRDSGWLLVQILRKLGLAARFVSGYLVQLTADVKSLDGPSGPENDFTDLHAWTEVYIPGAGWIGLDPTSGLFAGEGHIPLACTPHYKSAAPVVGALEVCETVFSFHNHVKRIYEDPRVTKPYPDGEWEFINAVGKLVDEDLQKMDVRLTMGGEPTFISIDDMQSAQWNTQADGTHKRQLAGELIKRLRKSFGENGMLYYGMGKWYPGEPIPRWKLGLYWRKDGLPIWKNEKLIAEDTKDYGFGHEEAKKFALELAKKLNISRNNLSPAYEDVFYFAWEEANLPNNLDPLKANLKDPLERQKLAEILQKGMDIPTGYVLPIKWDLGWKSAPWKFRRKHLYLIPGNSPMGLRLPLKSLPWIAPEEREPFQENSQLEELPPLPNYSKTARKEDDNIPAYQGLVQTALCVEARKGKLFVFIPPFGILEQYLDMISAIEATCEALQMPIFIEGYEPPKDYRIQQIVVTPDPGVIEVNIHPSKTWDELVHNTTTLYEQAYLSRLGTEKFMIDGKHSGTGGGNHVTLGGETPFDSPLLRRPDLLRSLITYWQHHPGLSYLFASNFIGPTSQAPRVDEGREETLYELEIAFEQIPDNGNIPPWLVDRIFRNLLIDITGNTHRAEFCIDKLYSPDSNSGRLGILEMRAFDMPPHKHMSLVQMLLVRALVAWFWKKPYQHKLVRWGTELHDRFLLEHYVKQDLKNIVEDLQRAGYPFKESWFEPFLEFRFPRLGTTYIQDMAIEVRMAIEPWHVLGEEMSNSGTARFVDSSLERVQIKVNGFNNDRFIVTCNGCRLPLRFTGTKGEYVAGVRYRAWQPPSALHPTIGVNTPLVFDIIDTWNGRSIGGCVYYVAHPGGRNYDTFPVNSYEAESRQVSRFWDFGHTPSAFIPSPAIAAIGRFFQDNKIPSEASIPEIDINEEYPYTLDMRRFWAKNKKK